MAFKQPAPTIERLAQKILVRTPGRDYAQRYTLDELLTLANAHGMKIVFESNEEGDRVATLEPLPKVEPWPL